jgi:outer membrane protein assembly factor BamB
MNVKIFTLFLAVAGTVSAGDWRQFRGPNGNGASDESVPLALNGTNSIAWQVDLPGEGLSSPIIVGDRIFVTASGGVKQQRLYVICFGAKNGVKLWERQLWATGRTMCHKKTAVAAPTPASDGKHVVAIFSSNDIVCFDLDGNLVWFRGLGRDYPNASNSLGMSSSLVIAGGVVVAQVESESDAFTVGLDLATGLNRWKLERHKSANWTSPVKFKQADKELVLLQSPKDVTAIEPATGSIVWNYTNGAFSTPSSTLSGDKLYVPSQGLTALDLSVGPESPKQLWRSNQLKPGTPSPTVVGGKIFSLNDGGVLSCGYAVSGERLWQLRLKGPFSASPVVARNAIYCVSEKGVVQVVDPTKPEGAVASELELGEPVLSTPAIANGAIYFRSDARLWKVGSAAPVPAPAF